jgi:hypothetical protein
VYYWIVDYKSTSKGKLQPVIIGGHAFTSEMMAQDFIDRSNLSPRAEIFPSDYSSESKAVHQLKGKLIQKYKSLEDGMQRVRHVPAQG